MSAAAIDAAEVRLEKLEKGIALMFESERSVRNDQIGRLEAEVGRLRDRDRWHVAQRAETLSMIRDLESRLRTVDARETLEPIDLTNLYDRVQQLESLLGQLREAGLLEDRRDPRQPDPSETPGRRKDDPEPFGQSVMEEGLLRAKRPNPNERAFDDLRPNPRNFQDAPPELRMALDEAQAQEKEREARRLERDPWANRSKGMRCATCMFFVPKTPDPTRAPPRSLEILRQGQLGRCRRHAPTMKGYPAVFETDWCGEHKIDENKL